MEFNRDNSAAIKKLVDENAELQQRITALQRELEDKIVLLDQVLERLRPTMPIVAALLPGRGDEQKK